MAEEMRHGRALEVAEAALAEHVILALGNIRAGLHWFAAGSAGPAGGEATDCAPRGVERIDMQIAGVEERARRIRAMLHDQGRQPDEGGEKAGGTSGDAGHDPPPLFVSRRR